MAEHALFGSVGAVEDQKRILTRTVEAHHDPVPTLGLHHQDGGAALAYRAEYLDGQPLNIGYINLPLLTPTQDSIGEFKVQYNNLGPEWGKFSGGVINLSTKSGTNKFTGSAFEYFRDESLNAKNPAFTFSIPTNIS